MSRALFLPMKGKCEWKVLSNEPSARDHQINQFLGGSYEFIELPGLTQTVLVLNDEREMRGMRQNKHVRGFEAAGPAIVMRLNDHGEHAELNERALQAFIEAYGQRIEF